MTWSSIFSNLANQATTAVERVISQVAGAAMEGMGAVDTKIKQHVEAYAIVVGGAAAVETVAALVFAGKFLVSGLVAPLFFTALYATLAHDTFQVARSLNTMASTTAGGFFHIKDGITLPNNADTLASELFKNTILFKAAHTFYKETALPFFEKEVIPFLENLNKT